MLFFHTKVYFITFCKQLQHWYILMINMLPLYRTQIIIYMCEIIMFLASRYIINNVCSKWCIINAKIACTYILGQSDVNWGYKTYKKRVNSTGVTTPHIRHIDMHLLWITLQIYANCINEDFVTGPIDATGEAAPCEVPVWSVTMFIFILCFIGVVLSPCCDSLYCFP